MKRWDTVVSTCIGLSQSSLSQTYLFLGKMSESREHPLYIILSQASALCHKVDAQKYLLNLIVNSSLSGFFSFY